MSTRDRALRLVAAAAIATAAVACGPATAPSAAPSSAPVATPEASPDASEPGASSSGVEVWLPEWAATADVPDAVANRRPLPFCGIEAAPAPQPGIFVDRAVRLCFWEARGARREAEFVSIQSTIEGNRIATVWRLAADGTVEILTDFTQDPFGGGGWQTQTCAELVEATEGDELIGVADCADPQPLE